MATPPILEPERHYGHKYHVFNRLAAAFLHSTIMDKKDQVPGARVTHFSIGGK